MKIHSFYLKFNKRYFSDIPNNIIHSINDFKEHLKKKTNKQIKFDEQKMYDKVKCRKTYFDLEITYIDIFNGNIEKGCDCIHSVQIQV